MLHCYNRGCGQQFDPQDNKEDSCQYHPGEPYFHDVYKGWSCCKKKSVDFTDFLNFKGCTSGKHSNEKPPEPEKRMDELDEVVEVRAPITESTLQRPPFDAELVQLEPTLNANFKKQIDELIVPKEAEKTAEESNVIAVGTNCKNRGCTTTYLSEESNYFECVYHPGVPVFHEGMKYWSCCQRKTSDFSVFVAQKGCETGLHQWKSQDSSNEQTVKCRYDWHQTGNQVVVAIYAKMYDYRISYVQLNPIRLQVHLVFPQQSMATFNMDLELRGLIDPSRSTVSMMGTKLEITLCKAELGSWAKLDFPRLQPKAPEDELKQLNIDNLKKEQEESATSDSDSEVDLDDVGPVYSSAKITEIIE